MNFWIFTYENSDGTEHWEPVMAETHEQALREGREVVASLWPYEDDEPTDDDLDIQNPDAFLMTKGDVWIMGDKKYRLVVEEVQDETH